MLLLILLFCLKFVVSNGFQFDEFTGAVLSVGIPITLSWHFDIGDPDEVFFQRRDIGQQFFFQGDDIPSEITHPNGTLNVTFPSNGRFIVDVIASGTGSLNLINSTEIFDFSLASESSGSSATSSLLSSSASPSSEIGQKPSASAIPPSEGLAHGNRHRKASIIIGAVLGSVFSLLFLFGGATFLFIRRRKYRRLKDSLIPNIKITSERQSMLSLSPPSRPMEKEASEPISPVSIPLSTNLADIQLPISEQDLEGLEENAMERRNSRFAACTPSCVDTSEPQMGGSAGQQAGPQATTGEEGPQASTAATGDMAAEILMLRTQVRQLIFEQEADGIPGGISDPPPPYA